MKSYDLSNWFLGEEYAVAQPSAPAPLPGTGIIRNDYVEKVFPHGFTSDTTMLSPKEIGDAIVYMTIVEPRLLKAYLNQLEDAIATVVELKQTHRLADLKIRQFMASVALAKNDFLAQHIGIYCPPIAVKGTEGTFDVADIGVVDITVNDERNPVLGTAGAAQPVSPPAECYQIAIIQ